MVNHPYNKFKDELNEEMKFLPAHGIPEDLSAHLELIAQASLRVFERWLSEGRFDDLIAAVPENFDTSLPEALILKISDTLISKKDLPRLSKFWELLIKKQIKNLRWHFRHPQGLEVGGKTLGPSLKQVEGLRQCTHWIASKYLEALVKVEADVRTKNKVQKWLKEIAG